MGIKVLSLFDGMSCGQIAFNRLGVEVDEYYASEIEKAPITVAKANFPNTIHIGDVTKVSYKNGILYTENGTYNVGKIDYVIGGSPCQSISNLGDGSGLEGKSGLFFHWLRIKNEVNPRYWLLENVSGKKAAIYSISNLLGKEPIIINSNLLSAQNRKRLYWTNFEVTQPKDKNIYLKDILDKEPAESSVLTLGRLNWLLGESGQLCIKKRYACIDPPKAQCLTARSDSSWNSNYVTRGNIVYKLSVSEYEKLQTVPIDYTKVHKVSNYSRYKMLGNGWTVDVICHILQHTLDKEIT